MSVRPYVGPPYGLERIRALFAEETPERFTTAATAGRRTVSDGDEPSPASAVPIVPIVQPEWTSAFWRLMADDKEMAQSKQWWYYPVRFALARLDPPATWGPRRQARRHLIRRCMTMYLYSNYTTEQIAYVLGLKRHEAQRALEEAAVLMSRWIGVFGRDFQAYDQQAFLSGLNR